MNWKNSGLEKFLNNAWTLAIGGVVIGGTILSIIIGDLEIEFDWTFIIKIYNATIYFITIEIPLYTLFIVLVIGILLTRYFWKQVIKRLLSKDAPDFLKYTSDSYRGYNYSWSWCIDRNKNYYICNLNVLCPKCGRKLIHNKSHNAYYAYCTEHPDDGLNGYGLPSEDDVKHHFQENVRLDKYEIKI